ncbi:MAG TPA: DnaT-like ssDNA-binding domain-containing protein [Cellvibrio sp.]|nr:DnaT-like ssDNA-binding domain-containing protein [Cellvibrio sp.]
MPPLTNITADWRPSDPVYQLLGQHNIPRDFIDDQVAEFVMYWMERGGKEHAWGNKFAKHVLHEWRRHEIQLAQGQSMHIMFSAWQPQQRAFDILARDGISQQFAQDQLPEFVLYWMDRRDVSNTWNTRFIAHVRYKAASNQTSATKNSSIREQLTDRTWATGGGNGIPKL